MSSDREKGNLGILTDWRWKLMALVLAVAVFYTVRSKISHVTTIAVPVEMEKVPGLAVLKAEPFSVRVTFRGTYMDLQALSGHELRVVLRPRSADSGESEMVPVRGRDIIGRPDGVRVVGVEPDRVRLTFDRQISLSLPVAPPLVEGRPLRGRVEMKYDPHAVTVKGARRQLEALKAADYHLLTEPINVEGCVQSFTKTVRIATPSGGAMQADISPAEVAVTVNINTEQSTREIRNVPVLVVAATGRKNDWWVEPPVVQVRLTGRAEVVQAVDPDSLLVLVDARKTVLDSEMLPVLIYLPTGVTVDAMESDPPGVMMMHNGD